ncbi:MAG: hypothetical protein WC494_02035 [Candidatus Pacearchaeota archaeon]
MALETFLTEEVPGSKIQTRGDSDRPYQKIIDYFRSVGDVISRSNQDGNEAYIFELATDDSQIVIVRGGKDGKYYLVEVYVIGRNAPAVTQNLVLLFRLVREEEKKQSQETDIRLTDR